MDDASTSEISDSEVSDSSSSVPWSARLLPTLWGLWAGLGFYLGFTV